MKTNSFKVILVLLFTAFIVCSICACGSDTHAPGDTINSTISDEMTRSPTQEPIVIPSSDLSPTGKPVPADNAEEKPLFAEDCYAVLPGEGAYFNVFDCYGKQIYSFLFTDGEAVPPVGVFTMQELSVYCRLNAGDVHPAVPVVPEESEIFMRSVRSYENGFYQIDYVNYAVYLYSTEGKLIQTLQYSKAASSDWLDIAVKYMDGETIVSFSNYAYEPVSFSILVYIVEPDGTIDGTCEASNLPQMPNELLAGKYFLVYKSADDQFVYDIYDFSGNKLIENVSVIDDYRSLLFSSQGVTYLYISNYYLKDGQTYNSSFQPVPDNTKEDNGDLIYGVRYDVQGIKCQAIYRSCDQYSFFSDSELVAFGTMDDRIGIKTKESEYVIDAKGLIFSGMNNHVLLLADAASSQEYVYSLETGRIIYTLASSEYAQIADEYLLICSNEYDQETGIPKVSYILDKTGTIRLYTDKAYPKISSGEYIVLHRGPYVGIADLDGNWIMKTLNWEMTRDQEYKSP